MIDYNSNPNCGIYEELKYNDVCYWFDYRQRKFLHNIDTFYYSVKLENDFTAESVDPDVKRFRGYFEGLKKNFNSVDIESIDFFVKNLGNLLLKRGCFARMYDIRLNLPEEFDIFIAPVVPHGSDKESVTSEIVVQLRSYSIWTYGIYTAFEKSYDYIKAICNMFNLKIAYVQENRVDYCWHTNYFSNPSNFFNHENFYKLQVSRYKDANDHTFKRGKEGYEMDYLALGRRGSKCFIRIYHKTKEVIEMGYKPFFFKIWFFNGLINRFDLYCYEEAFKRQNYNYLDIARLKWYVEYGSYDNLKTECKYYIDQFEEYGMLGDEIIKLADKCTPKLNMIINVEFQTMRKASKSFQLIPFHGVSNAKKYSESARIYDYLDNHAVICDYLTHNVLRLVSGTDENKARRPYCPFWAALRHTKMVEFKKNEHDIKLVREYNRQLNFEVAKKKTINQVVRLGFYTKGNNGDNVGMDLIDFLCTLNDNDIKDAEKYKAKQIRHLSKEFEKFEKKGINQSISIINNADGGCYDRETIDEYFSDIGSDE